jgi:hypothetical protein
MMLQEETLIASVYHFLYMKILWQDSKSSLFIFCVNYEHVIFALTFPLTNYYHPFN